MMNTDVVYDIINNHADNEKLLFLLDAPTGFGKTHNSIKYIQKNYKYKKIFFITNQIKLLPDVDKMTRGLNDKDANELKDQLLYLSSYYDSFQKYFDSSYKIMDEEFKKMNYQLIMTIKSLITNLENEKDSQIKQLFYDKFTSIEREFRKQIKVYLKQQKYTKREIQDLKWLTDLYPSILLDKKQIVLLTTKKFFLPIDMIYENPMLLYNKRFDNSILFIDEFDTTKQVLLDIIIENTNNNYKIDCFRLFRILQNTFEKNILEEYSKVWENEEVSKIIKYLKELFLETNKKYQSLLNFPFKIKDESLITKHFIFNDDKTLTIGKDTDKKIFYTYHDQGEGYNYIVKVYKKDIKDDYVELEQICHSVIYCINEFCEKMVLIINGYMEFYNKNKPKLESNLANQDGCHTIIDFLNIGEENKRFIVNQVLQNYTHIIKLRKYIFEDIENKNVKRNGKYNFYENGFSYLEVKDDIQHNLESKCYLYSYNTTPEKIIASTALNYHIIGISATSSFESPLVNYDLKYLKQKLNIENLFPDQQEQLQMEKVYDQQNQEIYKDVKMNIHFVDGEEDEDYFEVVWRKIFGNEKEDILNNYKNAISNQKYLYRTMANLYIVFYDFVVNNQKSSFIYFLTFNLNNRKNFVKWIIDSFEFLLTGINDVQFKILDSLDFDKNYENIKTEYLEKGQRIFIITNYNTVGAGINLQYKVTKDNSKYCPHIKIGEERDYDGIFLSKPTNIIPSLEKSYFDYKQLAYAIYALEYLKAGKQIQYRHFKESISNLFKRSLLNYEKSYKLSSYYQYEMICIGAAKVLSQALGRICRTENKNKIIDIYIDKSILNYLYPILDVLENKNTNYELNKILKHIHEEDIDSDILSYTKLKIINRQANRYIWSILSHFRRWTIDKIQEWQYLREFVLKYPTCDDTVDSDLLNYYFLFEDNINKYSYNITKKVSTDITELEYKMSSEHCGLEKAIKNIKGLKEYFLENGYAINFEKNPYILSSNLYHHIYKGALGEAIGKYLLLCYGIELCAIDNPDYFERFDYCCNDIYFDFKNWDESFLIDESKEVKKTLSKAKEVGARKVFVINVFSQNYRKEKIFGNQLITVPWLYDLKTNQINRDIITEIKISIEESQ